MTSQAGDVLFAGLAGQVEDEGREGAGGGIGRRRPQSCGEKPPVSQPWSIVIGVSPIDRRGARTRG